MLWLMFGMCQKKKKNHSLVKQYELDIILGSSSKKNGFQWKRKFHNIINLASPLDRKLRIMRQQMNLNVCLLNFNTPRDSRQSVLSLFVYDFVNEKWLFIRSKKFNFCTK